jgi:hypothetical protein
MHHHGRYIPAVFVVSGRTTSLGMRPWLDSVKFSLCTHLAGGYSLNR